MLSRARASDIERAGWFCESSDPLALIDSDLRIRAVNAAYERAVDMPRERMLGRRTYEAFPDNPADPCADGVANTTQSFETVLRTSTRHCIGVQRYDTPDRDDPGRFAYRVWSLVNTPLTECHRTVAVLHQPQDVTTALPSRRTASSNLQELQHIADLLGHEFPRHPAADVLGVVARSHAVVIETTGGSNYEQTEALARLRLEVRAGHPARRA